VRCVEEQPPEELKKETNTTEKEGRESQQRGGLLEEKGLLDWGLSKDVRVRGALLYRAKREE